MKFLRFTIFLLFVQCSIKHGNNTQLTKKLDDKIYKKLKRNHNLEFVENDSIYTFRLADKYILDERKAMGERLKRFTAYDTINLTIAEEGMMFSEIYVGEYKKYNPKGEVIEVRYYDKDFSFNIRDLIKKAKNELELDLNEEEYTVVMHIEEGLPIYLITYLYNVNGFKCIKVSGVDGTIIFNKFAPRTE